MGHFVFSVVGEAQRCYAAAPATIAHRWGEITPGVSQCVGKLG